MNIPILSDVVKAVVDGGATVVNKVVAVAPAVVDAVVGVVTSVVK